MEPTNSRYRVIGRDNVYRRWIPKGLLFFALAGLSLGINKAPAFADDFYPRGDSSVCNFAAAVTLSIRELPAGADTADSLVYDRNLVSGEMGNYPQTHIFTDTSEILYPNARRYNGVADRVAAPPGAVIDYGFFAYNYSGHTVQLGDGILFLSKNDGTGSATNLGAEGYYRVLSFLMGSTVQRSGVSRDVAINTAWPPTRYNAQPNGISIYSFTVSKPLRVIQSEVTHSFNDENDLVAHVSIAVQNDSGYTLENIVYKHGNFILTRMYAPSETYTYTYDINLGRNYQEHNDLGYAEISDPNSQTECSTVGGLSGSNFDTNSRTLLFWRTDSPSVEGWFGLQASFAPVPGGDSMCVTRIPYKINTSALYLDIPPVLLIDTKVSDDDEKDLVTVNSHTGEQVELDMYLINEGGMANDVTINLDYNEKYLDVVNACGGDIGSGAIAWNDLDLLHNDSWSCTVIFAVIDLVGEGTVSLVNNAVAANAVVQSNTSATFVNLKFAPNLNVSKRSSVGIATIGDKVKFVITISNSGNAVAHNISIEDTCNNCTSLRFSGSTGGTYLLRSGIDIPPGVYTIETGYEVVSAGGETAENCIVIHYDNNSTKACDDVYLYPSQPALVPEVDQINTFSDTSVNFVPGDILTQIGLKILPQDSLSIESTATNHLAYTGDANIFVEMLIAVLFGLYAVNMYKYPILRLQIRDFLCIFKLLGKILFM